MLTTCRAHSTTVALIAMVLLSPVSHAAAKDDGSASYSDMCVESANMPKPFGESDLKGNPKLQAYCSCFGPKFMARAQAAAKNMGKAPPSAAQQEREEIELRNSCRKQLGLPLAKPV